VLYCNCLDDDKTFLRMQVSYSSCFLAVFKERYASILGPYAVQAALSYSFTLYFSLIHFNIVHISVSRSSLMFCSEKFVYISHLIQNMCNLSHPR
jgi:hypothetical protein